MSVPYPFTAVVGLPELRLALLLNAVSPAIGGVLVRGEKGTAKSTIVRALAHLLPPVEVVAGCRFACEPAVPDRSCPDGPHRTDRVSRVRAATLVELPVGATEDRVVGALDVRRALQEGVKAYEPGLLAAAHRGLLYVDEVNLLPDHLVDLLLDAAAMGQAFVERDGISVRHAARFLLVGTMNPEEGELRPQLLDRFGLAVDVAAPRDVEQRAEVVRRRLAYERDPDGFAARWIPHERALAERIAAARHRLPRVILDDAELARIASVCAGFDVDGLRADIVVARTAVALAAWHDRPSVTEADVRDAVRLALPHRRRRDPFDPPGLDEQQLESLLDKARQDRPDPPPPPDGGGQPAPPTDQTGPPVGGGQPESSAPADPPYRTRLLAVPGTGDGTPAGRRSPAFGTAGRVVAARMPDGPVTRVHLPATLFAAAAAGRRRIEAGDIRERVHKGREANLVLFVVDASGSMAARQRMSAVKGAVLSLLRDAYQRRDKVGLITFRGHDATVTLPPTTSHEIAAIRLRQVETGGRTPLAAALTATARTVRTHRLRDPHRRALVVLVTDGRHTSGPDPLAAAALLRGTAVVVLDCESGPVRLGLAQRLANALDAQYTPVERLSAGVLRTLTPSSRRVA